MNIHPPLSHESLFTRTLLSCRHGHERVTWTLSSSGHACSGHSHTMVAPTLSSCGHGCSGHLHAMVARTLSQCRHGRSGHSHALDARHAPRANPVEPNPRFLLKPTWTGKSHEGAVPSKEPSKNARDTSAKVLPAFLACDKPRKPSHPSCHLETVQYYFVILNNNAFSV